MNLKNKVFPKNQESHQKPGKSKKQKLEDLSRILGGSARPTGKLRKDAFMLIDFIFCYTTLARFPTRQKNFAKLMENVLEHSLGVSLLRKKLVPNCTWKLTWST